MAVPHIQRLIPKGRGSEKRLYTMNRLSYCPAAFIVVSEGLRSTLVRHGLDFPGGACPQSPLERYALIRAQKLRALHGRTRQNTPCTNGRLQARAYLGIVWVISNQAYPRTGREDTWSPAYSVCVHRRTKSVQCSDKTLLWVLYFPSSPFVCTLPSAAIYFVTKYPFRNCASNAKSCPGTH